jgi:hypothetical protein
MTDMGTRWSEVGQRIEALALKLRLHFEQTGRTEESTDPLQKIRDSVTDAFEAAGNAVRDDAVKADVRETGRLFLDALSASIAKAAESLREKSDATPERPAAIEPATPDPPRLTEPGEPSDPR